MLANERFVANATARGRRGGAREARPLPARARCPRRLSTPPGSSPSRPGRRSSGSGGCGRLLAALGDPQLAYPAIHVVGTNGKSTATRTIEALLPRDGLTVGATVSPHVRSLGGADHASTGEEADFEAAVARVRPEAERAGATQFEAVTAAALAEFAGREVDVAVVEAGLGGRHDATNVLRRRGRPAHERRPRPHRRAGRDARGDRGREARRRRRRARSLCCRTASYARPRPGPQVVAGRRARGGRGVPRPRRSSDDVGGRAPRPARAPGDGEVWDGAHNPDGARWLAARLPPRESRRASPRSSRDKDVEAMLAALAAPGDTLVATPSSNARALAAEELARLAPRGTSSTSRRRRSPSGARARARARRTGARRRARSTCWPTCSRNGA